MIDSQKEFRDDNNHNNNKKRQLDGHIRTRKRLKKDDFVRLICFDDLPNEIYRELFDYLCSYDIIYSFFGLNQRLNCLIDSLFMKISLKNFKRNQYKSFLKQILPDRVEQISALELGQANCFSSVVDSEYRIDLFFQIFHLTQFSNLRILSLISPNLEQLESVLSILPTLSSLHSLYLLEHSDIQSQNETVCQLTLANYPSSNRCSTRCLSHVFIETSPPFKTLRLLHKSFANRIQIDRLQINIRCAIFFYPDILKHLNYDGLSRLITKMNYLKWNILCGHFQSTFDLIQCFPQIEYLSVKTIGQAYANGEQWSNLLVHLPNLSQLNLCIDFHEENFQDEYETFQTKFWFERKWFVYFRKQSCKYQFIHRQINPVFRYSFLYQENKN